MFEVDLHREGMSSRPRKTSEEPQHKCACLWDASLCVSYALLYPASNEKPVLKLEKLDSKA